jgi:thioredoxin-dependent peroxiredoxin
MAGKKATKKAVKKVAKKVVKKVAKKAAGKVVAKVGKKVAAKIGTKVAAKVAKPVVVGAALPKVGSVAPGFVVGSSLGREVSLAEYSGKTVVLYFYPKADTPGCTVEACGFRDAIAGYRSLGVDVLGISPDPVKDVTKFARKFDLTFPLLADADHRICEAYGVWVEKSMYGKAYMGAARTTFVIRSGKVAHVFEKVKPEGHDAEVLAVLKAM